MGVNFRGGMSLKGVTGLIIGDMVIDMNEAKLGLKSKVVYDARRSARG